MSKLISEQLMQEGKGVLRLAPTWVPRSFCRPGRRIKLHPADYYKLGLQRGAIDERWFASTTTADNGPGTPDDEGLSYVVSRDGQTRLLLRDLVDDLNGEVIGKQLWAKYHRWPMFSKFFDNLGPLPHHIHHRDEHARRVNQSGKPEMYFFPAQLNNHGGEFPFTFFGLNPETTREEVLHALKAFSVGDNNLTDLSRCFKLTLDTGWDVPPGVLHAPGSLCTYEPQFASDVYAMYQSVLYFDHTVPEALLWKNCPPEEVGNFEYLADVIDWPLNIDPDFHRNHFMAPVPVSEPIEMAAAGYSDEWICYKCARVSAKRLTVLPGHAVTVTDAAAYGFIVIQGNGQCNGQPLECPALIRYGQLSNDEYFVTESTARNGVTITNHSLTDPLVILRHFAENPDLPQLP